MQDDTNGITHNTPTFMNIPSSQPTASQLTHPPQEILYANQPQGSTPAPNVAHPQSTEKNGKQSAEKEAGKQKTRNHRHRRTKTTG